MTWAAALPAPARARPPRVTAAGPESDAGAAVILRAGWCRETSSASSARRVSISAVARLRGQVRGGRQTPPAGGAPELHLDPLPAELEATLRPGDEARPQPVEVVAVLADETGC